MEQNIFYKDYIVTEILSYLSLEEIISLKLLSKFHCDVIRKHHWKHRLLIRDTNNFYCFLMTHNFNFYFVYPRDTKEYYYKNRIYDKSFDIYDFSSLLGKCKESCVPDREKFELCEKITEKIKYVDIEFGYNSHTFQLFDLLLHVATCVEISLFDNKNNDIYYDDEYNYTYVSNIWIHYNDGKIVISQPRKQLYKLFNNPTTLKLLFEKSTDIKNILLLSKINSNDMRLVYKLASTRYFQKFKLTKLSLAKLFEAICSFDDEYISMIERDTFFLQKTISKRKYDLFVETKKDEICVFLGRYYKYDRFNAPYSEYIMYYNVYGQNTSTECQHTINTEVSKKLEDMIFNNFVQFFIWMETSPLRRITVFRDFIILNMIYALKWNKPSHVMQFIHAYIHNPLSITMGLRCFKLISGLLIDNHMCGEITMLLDILYSDIGNKLFGHTESESIIQHMLTRILRNCDAHTFECVDNHLKKIMPIEERNPKGPTEERNPKGPAEERNPKGPSLFLYYLKVFIIDRHRCKDHPHIFRKSLSDAINNMNHKCKSTLNDFENNFTAVTKMCANKLQSADILELWIHFLMAYYNCDFKNKLSEICKKGILRTSCNSDILLMWEKMRLPVRIKMNVAFRVSILFVEKEKFELWRKMIPIRKEILSITVLLRVLHLNDVSNPSKTIEAFDRWYNLPGVNKYHDSEYHKIIEKICSEGLVEMLEWWKNKGLPFYYTKKAFDTVSNTYSINTSRKKSVFLWWIQNCTTKKLITHNANFIQYGGRFSDGKWETPENMILLYSHCGLFRPCKGICELWKLYDLKIIHKKYVLDEIRKNFKEDFDTNSKLFIHYFGEK